MANQRPGPSNQRPSQQPPRAQQSSALATTEQGLTLPQLLQNYSSKIQAALPRHMTAERMIRVALTTFYKTPGLQAVDPLSVAGAIVAASELGLEPNGVLGHAYLVPFWNEKARRRECQLLIGYKGYVDLARRSGQVKTINAHLVYSADEFDCRLGTDEYVKHVPLLMRKNRRGEWEAVPLAERGSLVLTYAFAKLTDEGTQLEVMPIGAVERIREQHADEKSFAWKDHYEWMVRKTVIRQLVKLLPLSVELQTATGLEDRAEAGMSQELRDNLVEADKLGKEYSIPVDAGENSGQQGPDSGQPPSGPGPAPQSQQGPPPRQQSGQQQAPPPPPQGQSDIPWGDDRRGVTIDDFSGEDLVTLQGLLKSATLKLPPAEQISNRARVNAWLSRMSFSSTEAALRKADEMKFDAEQQQQG